GGRVVPTATLFGLLSYTLRLTTRLPGKKESLSFCAYAAEAAIKAIVRETRVVRRAKLLRGLRPFKIVAVIFRDPPGNRWQDLMGGVLRQNEADVLIHRPSNLVFDA